MRQFKDAISITIAIIIVVTVGFVQEQRSEKTIKIKKSWSLPSVSALGTGRKRHLSRDISFPEISCSSKRGIEFPLKFDSSRPSTQRSSLTGEREPSQQLSVALPQRENYVNSDLSSIAFMGTMCHGVLRALGGDGPGHRREDPVRTGLANDVGGGVAADTTTGQVFQMMEDLLFQTKPPKQARNLCYLTLYCVTSISKNQRRIKVQS